MPITRQGLFSIALAGAVGLSAGSAAAETTLLNVSYDPTRELYVDINAAFSAHWKAQTGEEVSIQQSHGGSAKQARAVIEGLEADVVTLALESDINQIAESTGRIAKDWRSRFPDNSSPYTSTIVFLVREGNPEKIVDWGDLVRDGVEVVTPNPKTSGGARWNYLAAWAWASEQYGGDEAKVKDYIAELFRHVPVLDTGARGSTLSFGERGIGDVLLAWENEAHLALREYGPNSYDIVYPSSSIIAEPPVAIVDAVVDARGTRKVAEAYLTFLYSEEAQKLIAQHHYRPSRPELVPVETTAAIPDLKLVSIDDPLFGGWAKAQPYHFGEGGLFDQLYAGASR